MTLAISATMTAVKEARTEIELGAALGAPVEGVPEEGEPGVPDEPGAEGSPLGVVDVPGAEGAAGATGTTGGVTGASTGTSGCMAVMVMLKVHGAFAHSNTQRDAWL